MVLAPKELLPMNQPTWTRSGVLMPTLRKIVGRARASFIEIEVEALGCTRDSLLGLTLDACACPVAPCQMSKFRAVVRELCRDPRTLRILQASPSDLECSSIRFLYQVIDDIAASPTRKDPYSYSHVVRKFFLQMPIRLSDGGLTASTGFKSRHPYPQRKLREQASNRGTRKSTTESTEPLHIAPIHSGEFSTLAERNKNAYEKSRTAQLIYKNCCETTIQEHHILKNLLISLRDDGNPEMSKVIARAKVRTLGKNPITLMEAVHLVEHFQLQERQPPNDAVYIPLHHLKELTPKGFDSKYSGAKFRRELLLSHYYLPAQVIVACFVAIQLEHCVNSDVIASLTLKSISKTKEGYIFTGIKGRTDTRISKYIEPSTPIESSEFSISHKNTHVFLEEISLRALELLLENARTIAKHLKLDDVHLMTCLDRRFARGHLAFHLVHLPREIARWCKTHNLDLFSLNHLRALGAQTKYLSPSATVFDVQNLLDHKDSSTTWTYLETHVIKWLHFANIRRFMDMLATSIFWRTDREDKIADFGLNKRNFKLDLLFPIEWGISSEPCIIDKWLASQGSETISLGLDELKQCAYQFRLYREQIPYLAQSNPHSFEEHHIPRILTCIALRKIILTSVHADVFREIEKKINEKI